MPKDSLSQKCLSPKFNGSDETVPIYYATAKQNFLKKFKTLIIGQGYMGRYILSVFLLMYPRDVARSENLGGQVDGDDAYDEKECYDSM